MSGFQLPGDLGKPQKDPYILDDIAQRIQLLLQTDSLKNRSRKRKHMRAKVLFIHTAYYEYHFTQEEIAHYLGYQDHSTVSHHLNKKWLL